MTKMVTFRLILLAIIANVMGIEVTNSTIDAVSPEPKNFKFEDQIDVPQSNGLIQFEDQDNKFEYSENHGLDNESQREIRNFNSKNFKFQEENRVDQRPNQQKKKRRRRRPRQKLLNGGTGFQNGGMPGYLIRPNPVYPGLLYPGPRPYPQPGYPGQFYTPQPSAASTALTAVTEALGSIAQYDDRQCVARLLCEAAGGREGAGGAGGTGAGGLLQAITGLQPLLTLLAAYNGISSSPLFVFGRAVFLGMTSRSNPGTCRYAYPDCPNDTEQLVHYLNNHNGGFFRFFAAPQIKQQQNLEQFYNQLSGQYGYYQPQQDSQHGQQQNYHNPNLQQFDYNQQQYYPHQNPQQGFYQSQYAQQGYGHDLHQQNYHLLDTGYQRPNLYGNRLGSYGHRYPYQSNLNNYGFKSAEIQKRIQNTRNTQLIIGDNVSTNSKWKFPDSGVYNNDIVDNVRLGKVLKFPQYNIDPTKVAKGFVFPGSQSDRDYTFNNIEANDENDVIFDEPTPVNDVSFENQRHREIEDANDINKSVRILYIVRGNGDPNNPEIVRLPVEQ